MVSRCTAIKKLAKETYEQYVCYGDIVKDTVIASLKAQEEFVEKDILLSNEERKDMHLYISACIIEIILHEYIKSY